MTSLIEQILSTGIQHAGAVASTDLPRWVSATPCEDPVQEFLIATHECTALANYARDSVRSYTEVEGMPQFGELLLIPILHPGPVPIANNPQVWQQAQDLLVQQLHRLFPSHWRMGFFKEVLAIEDLLGMPYPARRVFLTQPAPGNGSVSVQEYPRLHPRLPTIVPQLGFMVAKAVSAIGWPTEQLNSRWAEHAGNGTVEHEVWKSILNRAARVLQFAAWETPMREPDQPAIYLPGGWSHAVEVGVCAWLDLLHTECTITGYDIALDPRDVDLQSLEIRLASGGRQNSERDDHQPLTLRVGVRRHALEPRVWSEILTKLHRLAGELAVTSA